MEKQVPAGSLSKFLSKLPLPTLHLNIMPLSIKEKQAKQTPYSPLPLSTLVTAWILLVCGKCCSDPSGKQQVGNK